jgi:hypothetical protein
MSSDSYILAITSLQLDELIVKNEHYEKRPHVIVNAQLVFFMLLSAFKVIL